MVERQRDTILGSPHPSHAPPRKVPLAPFGWWRSLSLPSCLGPKRQVRKGAARGLHQGQSSLICMVDIGQQVDLIPPPQRRLQGPSRATGLKARCIQAPPIPHPVKATFTFMTLASPSPQWLIAGSRVPGWVWPGCHSPDDTKKPPGASRKTNPGCRWSPGHQTAAWQ